MTLNHAQRGFTLIEALIYLGLFSILMGGATVAAYNLFDTSVKIGTRTMLQEESDFMMAKIDWVLSGAKAVTAPSPGLTGSSLIVAKWDTSLGDPMTVAKNGGNLTIAFGTNPAVILNNSNTLVSSVTFNHIQGTGDGTVPEAIETVLTISANTPTGALVTRTATSTVFLRR
jgi:type II secretory pathway pseudopilin PulG